MDLGLNGRRAIVSAASKGLGRACAFSLAAEGVDLVLNARSADALDATAEEIRAAHGVNVTTVAADFNSAEGRAELLAKGEGADILVTNPGIRQIPGEYQDWTRADWDEWFNAHFFSSLEMITGVLPGMRERKFGRIVNISVSFIKFPQPHFAHSHSARLALSGAIASLVKETVRDNVTINTVCPGFFDTDALHTNLHNHARRGNTTYEAIVENRIQSVPAGRFADPSECGDLVAFLCSAQAGFIVGQNIINDGGVYQGLF
ncbi:SDR family oxidoreductase [Mameliella sediminis]|uniref:SDR family oxidoreductase n=1 Tax=Mameliella sediminis TaxID=2836866 RepID=UPI001C440903|nr:SDR family oxidoreductase [Mameliella sediminis]MBY6146923.1 SDR family oxidoreductase [Mameliella alba]MBV7397300.1 SDR family oxidoreductase [Mameliella sediminis]MBY6163805.1 SDR family oxidoreductase [Mameliella alba]MBY6172216.1 SDR family oxidoreductase [Mameliella alba]MBY6177292.1 SDR family oxidoreductase [Mameliella alba]